MLLHDPNRSVCRFFAHADYMDTTQNEKRLVINGLFFSVTVGLVMIYMVSFHRRFFNHAVITMRIIVSTMAFYHAVFRFSCNGCTLFRVFLTMRSVVMSVFCHFGSFFLHGRDYAFTWGSFFYIGRSSCKTM